LYYFSSDGYIANKTRSSLDLNIVNMLVSCVCGIGAADTEVLIFDTYDLYEHQKLWTDRWSF